MSLQVWLPLAGDLHNQGLSNINITNTSAVINNSGKIGKCYSFGTAKSYLKFDNVDFIHNFSECSISLWINILTWNTSYATYFQFGLGSTPWAHYIFGLLRNNAASTLCFTISNGSSATNANCLTPALELNTWYHLTFTYANGHCKIYVNGENTKDYTTTIVPNFAGITTGIIGACNNGSNYQTNCLMNDFRIYDHALSDKEVEEIAKGLVLHYKLNSGVIGNHNLLANTKFIAQYTQSTGWDTSKNGTLLASSWGGYNSGVGNASTVYHAHLKKVDNEWVYEYVKTANESWLGISQGGLQSKLTAGQTYTFSWEQYCVSGNNYAHGGLYYYKTGATSANFHLGSFSGSSNRSIGQWQKFSYTFTAPSDGDYTKNMAWYIYGMNGGNGVFYMRHPKLEIGPVSTAFNLLEENTVNLIYDSSGYQHDGELINSPTFIADTARFNSCLHMSATNQKVKITGLTTTGFSNSYSFVWWEKISSTDPMHWGFADGVRLNGMYTGHLWNTGDGSNNPLYKPGTTTQVSNPTINVWHHWVMTGDGSKCKVYQDGILWGEAKTYKTISGTTIYINGWDAGTSYCSNNASMSDFRIYATALTAEQVLDLYHTSASIDKKGNIYARELVEE